MRAILFVLVQGVILAGASAQEPGGWKKHEIFSGARNATAVAADFTGNGQIDVIVSARNQAILLVGPRFEEQVVLATIPRNAIHSEMMDVDGDGRMDWIGAIYSNGPLIFWLRQPADALNDPWEMRIIDDGVNGIHGLLVGDVDGDGKADLIANSAQPSGTDAPESLVWYRVPADPLSSERWQRLVLADRDAPGLSHYLGLGDVDGDGRADVASGAKGDPAPAGTGDWFAWWKQPIDPAKAWEKRVIATGQVGATNIIPVDLNGDGVMDFAASRGHGRGVVWFEGPDWKAHELYPTLAGPHCLVVADLTGNGHPDIATCAKDDRLVVYFANDGKGNFTTHVIGENQAAYDIRAVDMNRNGRLDLLIAGQASGNVVWYENPGTDR